MQALRVPWWRHEAADNQLKVTVEAISALERVRQQQEHVRHGVIEGGSEGGKHVQQRIGSR